MTEQQGANGPNIAALAALVADPVRAQMVMTLMDGRAFTATELAQAGGVSPQTASSHLAKLCDGGLIGVTSQGRHRYYRLGNAQVAQLLETLGIVATSLSGSPPRPGPKDAALRRARICYDHLAGEMGVRLLGDMQQAGWLRGDDDAVALTSRGERALAELRIDVASLRASRRPLCRTCLDWSERRPHLGGSVGAALMQHFLDAKWARRGVQSRAIVFSPDGLRRLEAWLR